MVRKEFNRESALTPIVSGSIYSLCYYLAFGAVYAGHLILEVVPPDSVIRHGLRDGAEAAQSTWAHTRDKNLIGDLETELADVAEVVSDM